MFQLFQRPTCPLLRDSSGKRYLSFVNHSVYTYSDSGDCRYGRTVSTLYNEDGSVMREDQSSEKMILYIK